VSLALAATPAVVVRAQTPASPATISLDPACGQPGGARDRYSISVAGANFNPFTSVMITFDAGEGGQPESFQTRTDGFGQFTQEIAPHRRAAGVHQVRADDFKGREASASFSVPCEVFRPTLLFSPRVSAPGMGGVLRGTGFPRQSRVALVWEGGLFTSTYPREATTDANGRLEVRFVVFRHELPKPWKATASPGPSSPPYDPARADFLVVLGSEQPRDFRFRR
jgi:hypothetical protein